METGVRYPVVRGEGGTCLGRSTLVFSNWKWRRNGSLLCLSLKKLSTDLGSLSSSDAHQDA